MDHLVCFLPASIMLGATGGRTLAEAHSLPGWTDDKERQVELAMELMKTCWAMYAVTLTGLAPEIAWFDVAEADLDPRPGDRRPLGRRSRNGLAAWKGDVIIKPRDAHNLQRPETVESLFVMWRVTENPLYREWGWQIFQSFQRWAYVGPSKGYTSLHHVNVVPPRPRDNMESF